MNLVKALKKLVLGFGGEAKSNDAVELVNEFAVIASDAPKLPAATTADAGKVLTVNSLGRPEWVDKGPLVPNPASDDQGKVLAVDRQGNLVWEGTLVLEFATTNPYTVATPISAIRAAFNTGRGVHLMHNNYTLTLNLMYYDGKDTMLYFGASNSNPAQAIYNGSSWSYSET